MAKRTATYGSKHEGLRMSSPPARTCDTTSPRRRLLPPADLPMLYAQPASVHFGGFALEKTYQQRVFVHNNSAKPVRLQYTMPSKGVVRAAFARERTSFVSPGLSEELVVTFKASAFQYHYDCIQVRCEEVAYASNTDTVLLGNVLIPIHAYPVLNQVQFPSRMDFGAVPLGGVGKKHFDLTCSVPIAFEYELELTKAHPSFTIFPLRGTIPANGAARIELEFRPLVYATESADVVLHVSQLGFTPLTCALTGSSSIDAALAASAVATDADRSASPPKTPSSGRTTPVVPTSPKRSTSPTKSSGESKPRKRRMQHDSESTNTSPQAMERVGGLEIPADLSTMASVNFVLTQQPGKLKPKDLKKAVEASRKLQKRQKEEQAKLSGASNAKGNNNDKDLAPEASDASHHEQPEHELALTFPVLVREEANFLTRTGVSRQIKEMFFAQELSDVEQMERELEFQSHKVHLGSALLTPQQTALVEQARALNVLELARQEREKLRTSFDTKAFNAQSQPTLETPNPPRGTLPAHYAPTYAPDFKTYKNDLWARRKRVVQRFVRAVSTCVVRLRAQRRLEKIKKWIGSAKTRAQVREKVALDWQRHGSGAAAALRSTAGTSASANGVRGEELAQRYFVESFPLVEEKSHAAREFIAQPADWDLKVDAFTFFPLRERDEALLSGHEPLELPPLATYISLESDRALRFGADDECGGPRDLLASESEHAMDRKCLPQMDTRTPSLLEQLPPDVFLRPSASVRPLVRIQSPRETDPSYVLRPQRVFRTPPTHFGALQVESVGLRSLAALQDSLLALHMTFLPPTERPRAQPLVHFAALDAHEGSHEDLELFEDVWYISQRPSSGIPRLAERADDVPCLSDSESDEDDRESKTRPSPTWADAIALFEDTSESLGDDDDANGLEEGELLGRAHGVSSFPRYRYLIRLERAYNAKREELLQLLPNVRACVDVM